MEVIREYVAPGKMEIQEFADEHNLVMVIRKMDNAHPRGRYCANFKYIESKRGNVLGERLGSGSTASEAVANYAKEISNELLVYKAYTPDRRKLRSPELYSEWVDEEE